MKYCRSLKFEEKPDYNYLRRMFKDLFTSLGYEYDFVYDWTSMLRKQSLMQSQVSLAGNQQIRKRASAFTGGGIAQAAFNNGPQVD